MNTFRHLPKQILTFAVCLGIRLIPARPANADPLLGSLMPQATTFSMLTNVVWITASMVIYDILTAGIGVWTWTTAFVYALISIAASLYFKKAAATRTNYLTFALVSTLVYDALTGLAIGPLTHGQPFMNALLGQIPFTMTHLATAFLMAIVVSPLVKKYIVDNTHLELHLPEKKALHA